VKIAILGSGAIGLTYGTKLALAGHDVHFLLRGGLNEARATGIHIDSEADGPLHLHPVNAHATPETIGPCDLVIIALKTTQNAILPDLIPPLLDENTNILTLQNGLGSDEFLAAHFGPHRVLGGLCFICLTRTTPATVRHVGGSTLSIGEFTGDPQPRTHDLVAAFQAAGVRTRLVADLATERWRKLVWNVPFNGLAVTAGDLTVDRLLADPTLTAEVTALMREIIATATALGHPIDETFVEDQIARTKTMGPYAPSTLTDHLAGREIELDAIWTQPLHRAQAAKIPTPHLAKLHENLHSRSGGFQPPVQPKGEASK
jgi:2-dehydropantoate 2-reductase